MEDLAISSISVERKGYCCFVENVTYQVLLDLPWNHLLNIEDLAISSIAVKWRIWPYPPFLSNGGSGHILHQAEVEEYVQILIPFPSW